MIVERILGKKIESFRIVDSDLTRDNLLAVKDFNEETKNKIKNSDILIIPEFDFKDTKVRAFYPESIDFFKFAKGELDDYTINFCENKGEELVLEKHGAEIWFPTLLIFIDQLKYFLYLMVIHLIVNYLIERYSNKETIIHMEVKVEDQEKKIYKGFKYDGSISDLEALEETEFLKVFKENEK